MQSQNRIEGTTHISVDLARVIAVPPYMRQVSYKRQWTSFSRCRKKEKEYIYCRAWLLVSLLCKSVTTLKMLIALSESGI